MKKENFLVTLYKKLPETERCELDPKASSSGKDRDCKM